MTEFRIDCGEFNHQKILSCNARASTRAPLHTYFFDFSPGESRRGYCSFAHPQYSNPGFRFRNSS
jgi:hypothetical protein